MSDELVSSLRLNAEWSHFHVELYIEAADRIEKLEAALASVLRFDLTDETWVKLGFDPLFIRDAFDAAIKTLDAE